MPKTKKIVIREINLKKAVITKTIWFGLIGLVLGIISALGMLSIPILGVYGAIGLIVLTPVLFAVCAAICTAICVTALNYGLKYSDGFEVSAEY
ncbi:MAG: hypothetical protein QW112_01800 [Candidatus Micrarchaeia archaeon]